MKKSQLAALIFVTIFLVSISGIAAAADPVNVTPPSNGHVKLTESNGNQVQLKSSFPAKYGCSMEPNGGFCVVKGPSFDFTASDGTMFAMNRKGEKTDMALYSGKVNYVLRKDSKVQFSHPGPVEQVYEVRKITPGPDGVVKGFVTLQGDKMVFMNTVGQLELLPIIGGIAQSSTVIATCDLGPIGGAAVAAAGGGAVGGGSLITPSKSPK